MSSPSRLNEGTSRREGLCACPGMSRERGAVGEAVGVGEYRYSRDWATALFGIVFGLAKAGRKKCAPVEGIVAARGVVGGEGEVEALRLFCWGTILRSGSSAPPHTLFIVLVWGLGLGRLFWGLCISMVYVGWCLGGYVIF